MGDYTAQELFELVDDLRRKVDEAFSMQKWANDNQFAQSYRQLAGLAARQFADDPTIGELQVSVPSELDALVSKDPSCVTAWVRMQLYRLATRLSHLASRELGPVREPIRVDLSFMTDPEMRLIVENDFAEAQRAYYADASKAASVLFGSVLEGMLVDVLKRTATEKDKRYQAFLSSRGKKRVEWSRVGLGFLTDLASSMDLVRSTTAKMAGSAVDFRNTVHPLAQLRTGTRAQRMDATALRRIIEVVAGDLRAASERAL